MRALPLALLLAACAPDPAPAPPEAGAADPAGLVLGADGLGALGAETPFTAEAVRAALPGGFTVEAHDVETAAGRVPALWALRDGLLVLEVTGGATVERVAAASDQVAGPDGARVGQTFAEAGGGALDCEPADEPGRAVCAGGGVAYVFAHGADGDALPPADVLAGALLDRIVWTAE